MKYYVKIFQRMLVITLFFLIAVPVTAEETVRLTVGEWPPFTSQKLKHYGVYSHIVSEAFALEGVKVEYTFFPWARGYDNVRRGVWDGSLTWAPTPDKEQEVLFSDPVVMHTKVFFHLKNNSFAWNTVDDLIGIKIGTTLKYTYGPDFDEAAKNGTIDVAYATSDIQNLKKLLFGRFQVFPSDIDVGYSLINSNFSVEEIKLFTHHPKPIQKIFTCVIFSKKRPEKSRHLLKLFNRGLEKLKKRGTYDKLLDASRRGDYIHTDNSEDQL